MLSFEEIYHLAEQKQGGSDAVEAVLPDCLSDKALRKKSDDRYLSEMSMRVFMAGLSWRMVKNKWPRFEERFFDFNPKRCAFMNADEIEDRMSDATLIRHLPKMKSIPLNAFMVDDIARQHGSFGEWLADWPADDLIGLWAYLKKHGDRLGGMSGPYFLRIAGKDTFLFTQDVVNALMNYSVIDRKPTSMKVQAQVQECFNRWHAESGRPMCEISRILSLTM